MYGLMQDWPLTINTIIEHASRNFGDQEVVTQTVEGPIERRDYGDIHRRARRLSHALRKRYGVKAGDRVAIMAWNTSRHMESWYALTGIGAIYHTINPRLHPEQIVYIINHAEDSIIFVDATFMRLVERIGDKLPSVGHYVVMTDDAHMPDTILPNAVTYESLINDGDEDIRWGEFDERTAAGLCYTSGTTGNPKGVLYSHRSTVLHSMAVMNPDGLNVSSRDVVMPVVPMFHVNGWSLPLTAPMAGAKLVLPGPGISGDSLWRMLTQEHVTLSAAVPTLWYGLLHYLDTEDRGLPELQRVVIGGAAVPRTMLERFESEFGVEVIHAWGMTEMSPMGTLARLTPDLEELPKEEQILYRLKQGRAPYTVELKIVDEQGEELPRDGKTFGALMARGPAVAKGYYKGEGGALTDEDGWFDTGDVATIDEHGFMNIVDRNKDVIKSGGEWISSVDLENLAMGHPKVAQACVIGLAHPKWGERPLMLVQLKAGLSGSPAEIFDYLAGKVTKWWMPDDIVFVDEFPMTPIGKMDKKVMRERFKDHVLPETDAEPAVEPPA